MVKGDILVKILSGLNIKRNQIFILCWIAYASIYFGRVNFAVAIPALGAELGVSKSTLGLVGSLFFWTYGIGQLINGQIGDKISTRKLIFVGLLLAGLSNIAFGLSTSIVVMAIAWMVNAFSQSTLWGPMVKSLSHWFPSHMKSRVAMGISTSMVGGYLLAWGLSGKVISAYSWQYAFIIPGVFLIIYAFIWRKYFVDSKDDSEGEIEHNEIVLADNEFLKDPNTKKNKNGITLWQLIVKKRLSLIVLACFAQGVLKDGIALWAPTMFMETWDLDLKTMTQFIIYIPIMNFFGILFAGYINEKLGHKEKHSTIILFCFGVVMLVLFVTVGRLHILLSILFLGLTSSMMFGANTILLGVVPMNYARYDKASSVAGFLDFSSYMAAGLAAGITGLLVDTFGWGGVIIMWGCCILIGIGALLINIRYDKMDEYNQSIHNMEGESSAS